MRKINILFLLCTLLEIPVSNLEAESGTAEWGETRQWIGPQFWANPIQDWSVKDGHLQVHSGLGRNLQWMTYELSSSNQPFSVSTTLMLLDKVPVKLASEIRAGLAIGIQGSLPDYRNRVIYPKTSIEASILASGEMRLGDQTIPTDLDPHKTIYIQLSGISKGTNYVLQLIATQGNSHYNLEIDYPAESIKGGIALIADAPWERAQTEGNPEVRWQFGKWSLSGEKIIKYVDRTFGPILWTQYTIGKDTLKLLAMMAPINGSATNKVALQLREANAWQTIQYAQIEPLSRSALFTIEKWNSASDTDYRVLYEWHDKEYTWEGTIRKEPELMNPLSLAVMSCDKGYAFPQTPLVTNVMTLNPDMLFFAGDQIYESFGRFGAIKSNDVQLSMLDYLRKYYQFGWTWRTLLKDRPSIIIPDDHDVFQGNIWGANGRRLGFNEREDMGGFVMPPEWVNAVQRTQVATLPTSPDPVPINNGIEVYYTDFTYGGVSFAVIEDRKFKTAPYPIAKALGKKSKELTREETVAVDPELYGERQETFLEDWAHDWNRAYFKVLLSQTLLAKATTHQRSTFQKIEAEVDSNAWPQNGRDDALRVLRKAHAFMIHGDQHLGIQTHLGVNEWEDAGVAFMVTGTTNGFERAWWPNGPEGENLGRFFDGLGNRMTITGAANPDASMVYEKFVETISPHELAQMKGSGFGIVTFNKNSGTIDTAMYHYNIPVGNETALFNDWPQTITITDNYGRKASGWLPEVTNQPEFLKYRPVIKVIDETNNEHVYTLRVPKLPYRPKVYSEGPFTLQVGVPERNTWTTYTHLTPEE